MDKIGIKNPCNGIDSAIKRIIDLQYSAKDPVTTIRRALFVCFILYVKENEIASNIILTENK